MAGRAFAVSVVTLLGSATVYAQQPATDALVNRAAAYAARFVSGFAGVVAEERYEQEDTFDRRSRQLVSDYLIVQVPGTTEWTSFRDVREVDGEPVEDRDARLVDLFLQPDAETALQRANAIARDSARYNLPGIGTLNNPLLVMAFLQNRYNDRFRWNVIERDPDLGEDVWSVRFEEFVRPTLLRGGNNRDAPAQGRVWVHVPSGRVVRTELRLTVGASLAGNTGLASRDTVEITTAFALDPDLGIGLPVEMTENYFLGTSSIRTTARYGAFRRFGVTTEETIDAPAPP